MIKNYFKIAWRNVIKHRFVTIINMLGLSIGITAAMVIYLIVNFNFSFDNYHQERNRIYRVVTDLTFSGEAYHNGGVTAPLAKAIQKEVTGVEIIAPFYKKGFQVNVPTNLSRRKDFKSQREIVFATPSFFDIFKYKWLLGSSTSLNSPHQVVLTENRAKLYFPELPLNEVMGKELVYNDSIKLKVAGIVAEAPKNTNFNPKEIISLSTAFYNIGVKDDLGLEQWSNTNSDSQLMLLLKPEAKVSNIEQQLNQLLKKYNPSEDPTSTQKYSLQPLEDIHFNKFYDVPFGELSNKSTLYGLLSIALFLLVLGCINFINLTTAQASLRAKEIGIRKTIGSNRLQIWIQFMSETFLQTLVGGLVALISVPLIMKIFTDFLPEGLTVDALLQSNFIIFFILLLIGISVLSGSYPGIILAGFKPIGALKNLNAENGRSRSSGLRKTLIVTQFVIAQFFIMCTLLVGKQIYYMLHKDMGFRRDAIVILNTPWKVTEDRESKKQLLLHYLTEIPELEKISMGSNPPSSNSTATSQFVYLNGTNQMTTDVHLKQGDENYIDVYQLKVLAGDKLHIADTTNQLLINETYSKILGFKKPGDAIGKFVSNNNKQMLIQGVIGDFYQKSMRNEIMPLVIRNLSRKNYGSFHIVLKPQTEGNWQKAISSMKRKYKLLYPEDEFDYSFYDDSITKFYKTEQNTMTLLNWATGLSILISCMGLLGLTIYTSNLKTKEIGVRKVLGASVSQIVALLSKELVILIILASIFVSPLAWLVMNRWLQDFADRTPINWWIFFFASFGTLLLALLVSGIQSVKAALANPIKSLRTE